MVLLNGYFCIVKGLRQGDPLSHYLFTLEMIVLSCLLNSPPKGFKYHWYCKELKLVILSLLMTFYFFFSSG